MAMTEDFSVFFNTAEFAVSVVHTPSGGSAAAAASAIFDANGTLLAEMGIATQGPTLVAPASTWPTLAPGASMTISAVNYKVRSVVPLDDGALVMVELARS